MVTTVLTPVLTARKCVSSREELEETVAKTGPSVPDSEWEIFVRVQREGYGG
jgi:hypothetical protein